MESLDVPIPRERSSKWERRWTICKRFFETIMVLTGLVGGGAALGYYACQQTERANHLEEIARLQEANKVAMEYLLKQAESATKTAGQAATSANAAVGTAAATTAAVAEVVEKVDKAADKADKAAKVAAAKAKPVVIVPPSPPTAAVQADVVNREIRKANEKIKESNSK